MKKLTCRSFAAIMVGGVLALGTGISSCGVDKPAKFRVNGSDSIIFEAGKACTLYLPFSIAANKVTGGKFHTFTNVDETKDPWEVTYTEVTGDIAAGTPYIFLPDGSNGGKIVVNNGTNKVSVCTAGTHTTGNGQWEFIGTYERIKWTHNTSDFEYTAAREAEIGSIYGFAAMAVSGAAVGEFVKVTDNVWINPMRAYLKRTPSAARWRTRGDDSLPEKMKVVIRSASGETTSLTPNPSPKGEGSGYWYSIDGRKLSGKPTKKGLYIHNGKKIVM